MKKKYFTFSNMLTWIMVAFIASMLFFPGIKAGVIRGLMTIGLFQPSVPLIEENAQKKRDTGSSFLLSDIKGQFVNVTAFNRNTLQTF